MHAGLLRRRMRRVDQRVVADRDVQVLLRLHRDAGTRRQVAARQARARRREQRAVLETERASKEAQSRFLAMLTHELRTPLSVLRLCLGQIAGTGRLRDHAENAVEQIDSVIDRCDLACRFDDGRLEMSKEPCCLHELVTDLITQSGAGGRIVLDVPEERAVILQTDPVLLRTILDNLIGNALKYSPAPGPVNVSVLPQPQDGRHGIRLRVENPVSGPAMRPDPEQVFTKYYRATQAQRSTGSGLGLYIVRGLSMMLGGSARYLSDQPNVVFEVWIPA
jgi:signal transduction histidine kinase